MTNEELEEVVLGYSGAPFTVSEMANLHDISWHRMDRLVKRLVEKEKIHYCQFHHVVKRYYQITRFTMEFKSVSVVNLEPDAHGNFYKTTIEKL